MTVADLVLRTAAVSAALIAFPAAAQKKGGTLRLYHNDTPASASLLDEINAGHILVISNCASTIAPWQSSDPPQASTALKERRSEYHSGRGCSMNCESCALPASVC
jgi:hypothetical protein